MFTGSPILKSKMLPNIEVSRIIYMNTDRMIILGKRLPSI